MENIEGHIRQVEFVLNISPKDYLSYYRGQVKWVVANSVCGKKIQFPANLLASHVTHTGISGRFILQYLSTGKAVSLSKIM